MGSETGVVELNEHQIQEKGRLGPGQMLAVDLEKKRILRNWDVKEESANRYPYLDCLLYTSPSPRDATLSRMPSSA